VAHVAPLVAFRGWPPVSSAPRGSLGAVSQPGKKGWCRLATFHSPVGEASCLSLPLGTNAAPSKCWPRHGRVWTKTNRTLHGGWLQAVLGCALHLHQSHNLFSQLHQKTWVQRASDHFFSPHRLASMILNRCISEWSLLSCSAEALRRLSVLRFAADANFRSRPKLLDRWW
jgi:hypothetical protein